MVGFAADRQGAWFWSLVTLAMCAPLLLPHTPPLVDVPEHMARYHIQAAGDGAAWLDRYYRFEWQLIPNLGADLLVVPLGAVLGVELAVKLIVLSVPVMMAAGLLLISRQVHGEVQATALIALPLTYSYPFQYGFLNFCLSVSLALLAFALWLKLGAGGRFRLRAALFVPISVLLWVTHVFGWGILGLMTFGSEAAIAWARNRRLLPTVGRATAMTLPLVAPMLLMLLWRSQSEAETSGWFNVIDKIKWLGSLLRDRWMIFDLVSAFLILSLTTAVLFVRRWFTVDARLVWAGLLLTLAAMVMPTMVFGSAFAANRLIPVAVAILLISGRPARSISLPAKKLMFALAGLFLVIRLLGHGISFAAWDRTFRAELAMLDSIPRGSRVGVFINISCGLNWPGPRLNHLAALAIVRRDAFTNTQWQGSGAQLLRINYPDAGDLGSDPSSQLALYSCWQGLKTVNEVVTPANMKVFDLVWLFDVPRESWPTGLNEPIAQTPRGALFKVPDPVAARPLEVR